VLTGFNTDVEYDGVVYHVQTEDKGLRTPFILSLVYTGGAILASKRSPYDDLIAGGFDEDVLAQRLSRQHKLICAAVHAGRIDDLKRLNERDPSEKASRQPPAAPEPIKDLSVADQTSATVNVIDESKEENVVAAPDYFAVNGSDSDQEPLRVILIDETEFRGGESVTLRVLASRAGVGRRQPARKARIVVKTLGTNFRPASTLATTNAQGVATIPILLPAFDSGRAAILVQAHIDGETAELRRIILPVNPPDVEN
jgi:hypothetical protein